MVFPIANQEIIGSVYTEIPFDDVTIKRRVPQPQISLETKFIKFDPGCQINIDGIPTNCPPALMAFATQRKNKLIIIIASVIFVLGLSNVIKINTSNLVTGDFIGSSKLGSFNVNNARAIGNFGNSCYFGVAMHLLYVMADIRDYIEATWGASPEIEKQYIRDLLIKMGGFITKAGNPITDGNANPALNFSKLNYEKIHEKYYPESLEPFDPLNPLKIRKPIEQEEDPTPLLIFLLGSLPHTHSNLYAQGTLENNYHVMTNVPLGASIMSVRTFFPVLYEHIIASPNAELQNILEKAYNHASIMDGVNSVTYNHAGKNQAVSAFSFVQMTQLPQYLLIQLNSVDPNTNTKYPHNIKMSITLDLQVGPTKVKYFFLGAIIHEGATINSGHFTALIFDWIQGPNFEYLYYDDEHSETRSLLIGPHNSYIPDKYFYKNYSTKAHNEMPYVLLYANITKLK